jgi:hypothetical protein
MRWNALFVVESKNTSCKRDALRIQVKNTLTVKYSRLLSRSLRCLVVVMHCNRADQCCPFGNFGTFRNETQAQKPRSCSANKNTLPSQTGTNRTSQKQPALFRKAGISFFALAALDGRCLRCGICYRANTFRIVHKTHGSCVGSAHSEDRRFELVLQAFYIQQGFR